MIFNMFHLIGHQHLNQINEETNQEYSLLSDGTCMESSRVQSISPGLPAPSHPVLGHSFLAVFLAVHRVEETGV